MEVEKGSLIDGMKLQRLWLERARRSIQDSSVVPTVALVTVSGDPLVDINFRWHHRAFAEVGLAIRPISLPPTTNRMALLGLIERLNQDDDVDAILTLTPLPRHLDIREVLATINPDKDVEGIHAAHVRRLSPLSTEPPGLLPLVPVAIISLLLEIGFDPAGAHVVVLIDPEQLEEDPVARMVAHGGAFAALPPDASGAVVPFTHPKAAELCREADLLVTSLNRPAVVTADWVKPGATVIDYKWIHQGDQPDPADPGRLAPRIVGAVDVDSVRAVAGAISAVPGGLGPVMVGIRAERIVRAAIDRAAVGRGTIDWAAIDRATMARQTDPSAAC